MSILYSKLRSSGEREASATAFELLKRLESSDTEQQDDDEEDDEEDLRQKIDTGGVWAVSPAHTVRSLRREG